MTQPWYPFYWADYSGKTLHLTQRQHGAYFLLLRFVYTTGRPIPHDQRFNIARADDEQGMSDAQSVLDQFFERTGDFWHNGKAEEIMSEADDRRDKHVRAGKERWKKGRAALKVRSTDAQVTTPTPNPSEGKPSSEKEALPDWIPVFEWSEFVRMRKEMPKSPFTDYARKLAITRLQTLRAQGHDPAELINEAVLKSWKTFFPPKEDHHGSRNNYPSKPNGVSESLAALSRAGSSFGDHDARPDRSPVERGRASEASSGSGVVTIDAEFATVEPRTNPALP